MAIKKMMDYPPQEFNHESSGETWFDPGKGSKHFDPWWMVIKIDSGIIDYYSWLLSTHGIKVTKNKLWGPHISAIKGTEPTHKELWGINRTVKFRYCNNIRYDNAMHAWIDVESQDLSDLRVELGIQPKLRYHLTLGRWGD